MPDEPHRPRQAGSTVSQSAFDWNMPDRYVKLLNFKIEVANILQMKSHDLNDEEKMPIIKKTG